MTRKPAILTVKAIKIRSASPGDQEKKLRKKSILPRLVILLVGFILSISALLTGILLVLERDRQYGLIDSNARQAADYMQKALALPIWDLSFTEVSTLIDLTMLDSDAYGVVLKLHGVNYTPIYRSRDRNWKSVNLPPQLEPRLIDQHRVIMLDGIQIAELDLYYTGKFVSESLFRAAGYILSTVLSEALLLSLALTLVLRRSIFRPLWTIESWAGRVSQGENLKLPASASSRGEIESLRVSVERMVSLLDERYREILKQSDELKRTLTIKEALARELYHRTRNNIQVICGLIELRLARQSSSEENRHLKSILASIEAISLGQEELYKRADLSSLDLASYLQAIADRFLGSFRSDLPHPRISVEAESLDLTIDVALPIGLIITELVANSIEHAFPGQAPGSIQVILKRRPDGNALLTVKDDGIGSKPGFNACAEGKLGLETVDALVAQIRGSLEYSCEQGFSCIIVFPQKLPGLEARI